MVVIIKTQTLLILQALHYIVIYCIIEPLFLISNARGFYHWFLDHILEVKSFLWFLLHDKVLNVLSIRNHFS
jgi:hypothetical protein